MALPLPSAALSAVQCRGFPIIGGRNADHAVTFWIA